MNNKLLLDNLRCIPDWPKKGVNFRDVTTLFKNNECLQEICDEMYELYKDKGITKIVGIESRGFVMSSALALRLGAGVVLCRKPGKLPCDTVQESYAKEYGKDTIEIHKDAIGEDDVILLHDDLLATGGTMKAACNLVKKFHPKKVYANFIIELVNEGLNGREGFDEDIEITSLIKIYFQGVTLTGVQLSQLHQQNLWDYHLVGTLPTWLVQWRPLHPLKPPTKGYGSRHSLLSST